MGWRTELVDDAGAVAGTLWTGHLDRSYRMPDGRRCPMPQALAWCRDCAAYVAAERVPSLTEIDAILAAARGGAEAYRERLRSRGDDKAREYSKWYVKKLARDDEAFWAPVREWRLLRRSPPRCLECFSTAVALLPEHAMETVHPSTGRRLHVRVVAHASMAYHWEYSVEGLPLEEP